MKGIDKKYIDVLQQFGFHLYTTETGYKLCYNPIGGTFSLKVALAFVKIDKESMVNENAAENV